MQTIPVDQHEAGSFLVLSIAPATDETGTQTENRDGIPQWKIECLHRPQAREDFTPKAGVEVVKIAARTAPTVPDMTPVRFQNLVARMWTMGTRSGISLSADAVQPLGQKE